MTRSASATRRIIQQTRRIMATQVDVQVMAPVEKEDAAHAAVFACLEWLEEVDNRLSRFRAQSELSRLNASQGEWFSASGLLFEAVEQSLIAAERSGGYFDPTILPALELLGYDRDFKEIVPAAPVTLPASTPSRVDWRQVTLDRARRRIRLAPGIRIDLGGIAKGWAADIALESFFAGFPNVLINLGGDMRIRGRLGKGEPWPVGIGNPHDAPTIHAERHVAVLTLARGGLATSGATGRSWYRDGVRQHHLLDPRTGAPVRLWMGEGDDGALIASVTAIAPTAAHAEVATKMALLRGYPEALRAVEDAWSERRSGTVPPAVYDDGQVALLLVLGSGEVVCSAHLPDYLRTLGGGGNVWVM